MIEVAVGVARRGREELDKVFGRLDGDLESKMAEMLATGLTQVGDEGRRLLALIPLFPAGNFMPEAMQAACAAAERVALEATATATRRPSLWRRLVFVVGHAFRIASPVRIERMPNQEEPESDANVRDRVGVGIHQLERAGILNRDQERNLYTFHQTLGDYAVRATTRQPVQSSAAFSGLLEFYARYLSITENIGDSRGQAAALHEMARLDSSQGKPIEARRLLLRSQSIFESLGDMRSQAGSQQVLAHIELAQKNLVEARRLLRKCRSVFERLGDLQGEAASLHELARSEVAQDNRAEVRRLLNRCIGIREGFGDLRGQAASLHEMAIIERADGNLAEARLLWTRSLSLKTQINDVNGRAATLGMLAQLEADEGKLDAGLAMARESLQLLEGSGSAMAGTARDLVAELETRAAAEAAERSPIDAPTHGSDELQDEKESTDHVPDR